MTTQEERERKILGHMAADCIEIAMTALATIGNMEPTASNLDCKKIAVKAHNRIIERLKKSSDYFLNKAVEEAVTDVLQEYPVKASD